MSRSIWRSGWVFAFFASLAFLDLNTLLLNINRYVPHGSTTDYYHFQWNYWWLRHALREGLPVYSTQHILYPLGEIDLGLHTMAPFWFPAWAMLEPLVGYIAAVNLIIWLSVTLMGIISYWWLKDYGLPRSLSLVGAACLMVLPWLGRAAELSHLNLLGLFYYPLTLLLWRRIVQTERVTWALALGVAFWCMWLTDTMWLIFVPVVLAPYGLLTLAQAPDQRARLRMMALGLLATGLFLGLGWAIAPMQPVLGFDRSTISPAGPEAAERWAVSKEVYLLQPESAEPGRSIGRVLMFLMVVTIFLTRHEPRAPRERWFWLGLAAFPFMLSVGPYLEIGDARLPTPYLLIHEAFDGLFRTPERFLPTFVICAVIFLTLSWAPHITHWRRSARVWLLSGLLVILIGDLRVLRPIEAALPVSDYDYYDLMREDGLDYVYVQVPVGMSSGWTEIGRTPYNQFRALEHEKRIVAGHVSRIMDFAHYYYANEAVWGWMTGYHGYRDEIDEALRGYVADYPIGYISLHQAQVTPEAATAYLSRLNQFDFLCPALVEGDAVLYRTTAHPDDCPPRRYDPVEPGTWLVDVGLPGDEFFIGPGFHRAEVIGGPAARWIGAEALGYAEVLFNLPDDGPYDVRLRALAPYNDPVTVRVSVEGQDLGTLEVTPGEYQTYTLLLPPATRAGGDIRLRLSYAGVSSPAELGRGADERTLAVALDWVRFSAAD